MDVDKSLPEVAKPERSPLGKHKQKAIILEISMCLDVKKSAYLSFLGALIVAFPAAGNDSTAILSAGGLELTTSDDIAMESEDLFLSLQEVRVRYNFHNQSNQDIKTRVAFPLPEVPFGPMDNVELPDAGNMNFVDFSVAIDGHFLKPELEQRAVSAPVDIDGATSSPFRAGSDITERVLESGLPLNANLPAWKKTLGNLTTEVRKQLVKKGVLFDDSGDGSVESLSPQWLLRETYHWEQTFRANAPTIVEHRYRPVVGSSFFTGEESDLEQVRSEYQTKYCLDHAGLAGVQRLLKQSKASGGNTYMYAREVSYVLTTGANWKGKIGHFKMTLDKSRPEAVLSSCADGIRKTGPTTFEVQRDNFVPSKDISFVVFTTSDE